MNIYHNLESMFKCHNHLIEAYTNIRIIERFSC